MRTRSKLLLAGLTVALTLSVAVASSSAGRLSVSTRNFTITWSRLNKTTTGGGGPIGCPFTMSGSFHSSTLAKVSGALIGLINRSSYNSTTCGAATVNQESLPWHIRYRSFRGTLPNISGVDLGVTGAKFTLNIGATCTNQWTVERPAVFIANLSAGRVTSFTPDSGATIPFRGSFFCNLAGNYTLEGTSSSVTALTITLI
jgi:hypothetical protein